jgi:uncharacterized membrane protein YphA (DoxX/SURF4 family)
MKFIVTLIRVLVGALFLFSGFIKANDPMGTSYKLQEYFTIFGIGFLNNYTDYLSILFCGMEIALGFAIILGSFSRITTLLLIGLIIFFTWLTGYSAITGKVTDCGCFGEFIKLKPLHSFYKDVVLLVLSIILLLGKDLILPIFGKKWNTVLLVLFAILSFGIPIWAFNHLPFLDMLAYKPGNHLYDFMKVAPGGRTIDSVQTIITGTNKTNGKVETMSMNEYMKVFNNYDNVKTETKVIIEADKAPIHDFIINDENGNPWHDTLLQNTDYSFWVVVYDVENADKICFTKINKLAENCKQNRVNIVGITHSSVQLTQIFKNNVQSNFTYYYAGDDKFVKTMMRSNPGLMLLKNGTVIKKWHFNDIPTFDKAIQN